MVVRDGVWAVLVGGAGVVDNGDLDEQGRLFCLLLLPEVALS